MNDEYQYQQFQQNWILYKQEYAKLKNTYIVYYNAKEDFINKKISKSDCIIIQKNALNEQNILRKIVDDLRDKVDAYNKIHLDIRKEKNRLSEQQILTVPKIYICNIM
jgi:hypothetical protein